ncbi:hypothetical protein [Pontimonas sp.]|uniref:hypothetical protein n=1 Tax=Pontimonas sp. TaxID=2304492 RepID=UPI002870A787|nr:hypothetical protein [Pontimonas sp.]MDR9434893.1 hypothetical protein [Pontimonas sp.]
MNRYLAGSVVMSLLLLVYLGFAVVYASILLQDDNLIVNVMGVALLVLPLLGAWGLVAEWRFGAASSRLRALLEEQGLVPEFPRTIGGRALREEATQLFPGFQAEVEAAEEDWKAWFRLGLAYDACGDRRRGRWAIRRAISLEKSDRRS